MKIVHNYVKQQIFFDNTVKLCLVDKTAQFLEIMYIVIYSSFCTLQNTQSQFSYGIREEFVGNYNWCKVKRSYCKSLSRLIHSRVKVCKKYWREHISKSTSIVYIQKPQFVNIPSSHDSVLFIFVKCEIAFLFK